MNLSSAPKAEIKSHLISEHELTLAHLSRALEAAVIDTEIDEEGDLLVEDTAFDWPVWIRIDPDEKLITLKTCLVADKFANWPEALSWVNAANARMTLVQFHIADGRIWGHHWMSYVDGLNVRQLIKTLRRFSAGFREGIMIEPERA